MRRGTAGSGRLRSAANNPSAASLRLQLLEFALERAFAGFLEMLDEQLVFAARLVETHARAHQHRHAVLRPEADLRIPLAPHGAAHLRGAVLQREIPMAGGGGGEIRKFPFQPQQRQAGFQQQAHFFIEARDRVDVAFGARGAGVRGESGGKRGKFTER